MAKFADNHEITKVQPVAARIENRRDNIEKTDKIEKVQPVAAQIQNEVHWTDFTNSPISKITWSHHMVLLDKTKNKEEYHYYLFRTISEGWSKRVLATK